MRIEVTQEMNKDYYVESYSEWLNFRSKYRKWEHIIGFISIGIALLIFMIDQSLKFVSIAFLLYGLLRIYNFHATRKKWLNDRFKSGMNGQKVKMVFEEEGIQSYGPFTDMNGKWNFFNDAIETEKGLFLIPENGVHIYLQKKSFVNQSDIKRIIEKIKENRC
jgi:uncharacterized protein YlzI (FlbEa/FlbD family)